MQWISWVGSFQINNEISKKIAALSSAKVLSIVGPARTGKSFLLNQLMDQQAFEITAGIVPCTKGIQVHIKDDMIILDIEGFGRQAPDAHLFALAVLLSSLIIYNNWGVIDEPALNQLSFVSHISSILTDTDHKAASLLWVLRDFLLELVDQQRIPITSNQYLEKALENTPEGGNKNNIRDIIRGAFTNRQCVTLIRPCEEESDLQASQNFRPGYLNGLEGVKIKVFEMLQTKSVQGRALNGQQIVDLAQKVIQSLNSGSLPNVAGTWEAISEKACETAFESARDHFTSSVRSVIESSLPLEESTLREQVAILKDSAIAIYKENAMGARENEFLNNLQVEMKSKKLELLKRNEISAETKCNDILDKLLKEFPAHPDSYEELELAWNTLYEDYFRQTSGVKRHEIFCSRAFPRYTVATSRLAGTIEEKTRLNVMETSRSQMSGLQDKYRALLQKEHVLSTQINYYKEQMLKRENELQIERTSTDEPCKPDCVIQ